MSHYQTTGTAATPEGFVIGRTRRVIALHRDGHVLPIELTVAAFSDDETASPTYLGIVRDVSDVVDAERRAEQLQRHAAVSQLVQGISHDFNNLLTAISGGIELARTDPGAPQWLDMAATGAQRAGQLIRQLRVLAHPLSEESTSADVAAVIGETADLVRTTIDRRIRIDVTVPPDLPRVRIEQSQLQQVILNLLVNARDAIMDRLATDSAAAGEIAVISQRRGDEVEVRVLDNGAGIPADVLPRIFDAYFTTKPSDRGTGLGLATAYGIVHREGGDLLVLESRVGRGTTFAVRLRVAESTHAPTAEASSGGRLDGLRVLVVDDEEAVATVAMEYLRALGATATITANPGDTVRLIHETQAQVVLLDINMPQVDGWTVLRNIRAQAPGVTVVIVSGFIDDSLLAANHPDGWLLKPYSLPELFATVTAAIQTAGPSTD